MEPQRGIIHDGSSDYLWLDWTRQELGQRGHTILKRLPKIAHEQWDEYAVLLLHNLKENIYISPSITDDELHSLLSCYDVRVIAFGHTHIPMLRRLGRKIVINPGSVGQPRDGDPRASYAIWEDGLCHLYRISYDVDKTVEDLLKLPLPANYIGQWSTNFREGKII
jgi:putative phosphoesterase